jgi:hypothetical protein
LFGATLADDVFNMTFIGREVGRYTYIPDISQHNYTYIDCSEFTCTIDDFIHYKCSCEAMTL